MALTEAEILGFLARVADGSVTLACDYQPAELEGTEVVYRATNGWALAVFNDSGEWDYLEWIDDGRGRVTYDRIYAEMPMVAAYAPDAATAWQAYGIAARATEAWPGAPPTSPPSLELDEQAFARLQEVLAGRARVPLDTASAKLLRVVLGGDTNAVVTAAQLVIHFSGVEARFPLCYMRRLAPAAVQALLDRAGLVRLAEAAVIRLPAGEVPAVENFRGWSHAGRRVWIVPGADLVRIAVRAGEDVALRTRDARLASCRKC